MSGGKLAIVVAVVAGIGGGFQAAISGVFGRRIGVLGATAFLAVLGATVLLAVALVARGPGAIRTGSGRPPGCGWPARSAPWWCSRSSSGRRGSAPWPRSAW